MAFIAFLHVLATHNLGKKHVKTWEADWDRKRQEQEKTERHELTVRLICALPDVSTACKAVLEARSKNPSETLELNALTTLVESRGFNRFASKGQRKLLMELWQYLKTLSLDSRWFDKYVLLKYGPWQQALTLLCVYAYMAITDQMLKDEGACFPPLPSITLDGLGVGEKTKIWQAIEDDFQLEIAEPSVEG